MPNDCIVLQIEEFDENEDHSPVDTNLFVLYDTTKEEYFICGKRTNVKTSDFEPYYFSSKSLKSVELFIRYATSKLTEIISFTLYNYNNLPGTTDTITYEFMETMACRTYEIMAVDEIMYDKKEIKKLLNIIKNVNNEYQSL